MTNMIKVDGVDIDKDKLSEEDIQTLANFQYVKQRKENNQRTLQDAAKDSIVLGAAYEHLAEAVGFIVEEYGPKGD